VLPLQHPLGHEVASHTHAPVVLLHSCPSEHAAQLPPAVPHEVFDSDPYGSQAPLAVQQPFGQELALQTHCPVDVLQASPIPHAAQLAPAAPHEVLVSPESASQVPALQQPAHDIPPQPQDPLAQALPPEQAPHAAPPVPHSVVDCIV
jgi:hypothetical protein